jgi:2-dehydropantoate 2-reductase
VLWEKWAFICAQGGVTSVTRLPIGVIRACAETWAFFRGVGEEIVALAAAGGPSLSAGLVERILSQAAALDPQTTSSLHHDVTHGHRLEIEALNGTAVRLGRARGVPTPLNLAITAALKPYEGGAAR